MKKKPLKKSCSKVQYKSIRDAYDARELVARRKPDMVNTHPYKCPYCAAYHLGNDTGRELKRTDDVIRRRRARYCGGVK